MGLKIVTTNGLTNCKKLLADASSFTKENGIDITTAPVDFETPPLENENDTPWTMDLTVKAVEKRALVLGKNIQPVRWLKQEQMKGRHVDFPSLPPGSPDDKLQQAPVAIVKPRSLFASSSSNNASASSFFAAAPKKQIGPSTKPGETIKGVAAVKAPVIERSSSTSSTTTVYFSSDQQAGIMDLSGESADVTKTVITSEGCVETAQKTLVGVVGEPATVEK